MAIWSSIGRSLKREDVLFAEEPLLSTKVPVFVVADGGPGILPSCGRDEVREVGYQKVFYMF